MFKHCTLLAYRTPVSRIYQRKQLTMAWKARCSSNDALISELMKNGVLKSKRVEKAMKQVDRGNYSADPQEAYNDNPHSIGWGATISAPHMHATCLELLEPNITKLNARVLDVGCGSGYLSACFGRMVGQGSKVVGIDIIPELVEWSVSNMKKKDQDLLDSGVVTLKVGDGWKGDPENGPFDAIHVGAAAATLPRSLVDQLALGGTLIIPVGTHSQKLMRIDRREDGTITEQMLMGVQYVPLVKNK